MSRADTQAAEGEAPALRTDALGVAYFSLKRCGRRGRDDVAYGNGLEERLLDLPGFIAEGGRFRPGGWIPKPDGGTRPLGIAALEDKIVQSAVAETILVPIRSSRSSSGSAMGSDPGVVRRCPGIRRTAQATDADATFAYFDQIDQAGFFGSWSTGLGTAGSSGSPWLSVMKEGEWRDNLRGTPQGSIVSPVLANVYLTTSLIGSRGRGAPGLPVATRSSCAPMISRVPVQAGRGSFCAI